MTKPGPMLLIAEGGGTLFLLWPVLIGFLLGIAFVWSRRKLGRWVELAPALGLTVSGEAKWYKRPPALVGSRSGRAFTLLPVERGGSKNKETWTLLCAGLPDADPAFRLRITREGVGSRIAKAFGGQDVQVGEPGFDARYRIRTSNPDVARKALDLFVQPEIPKLEPFGEIGVEGREARVDRKGLLTDPEEAGRKMEALARLADAVERAAPRK